MSLALRHDDSGSCDLAMDREQNIGMAMASADARNLLANPMMGGWIAQHGGADKEAFTARVIKVMLETAQEWSLVQEDGSIYFPTQEMLYFTAIKP